MKKSKLPGFIRERITEKHQKLITEIRNENSGLILNFLISVCLSIGFSHIFYNYDIPPTVTLFEAGFRW